MQLETVLDKNMTQSLLTFWKMIGLKCTAIDSQTWGLFARQNGKHCQDSPDSIFLTHMVAVEHRVLWSNEGG